MGGCRVRTSYVNGLAPLAFRVRRQNHVTVSCGPKTAATQKIVRWYHGVEQPQPMNADQAACRKNSNLCNISLDAE